jgi:ketosteroid isomerase-like protein
LSSQESEIKLALSVIADRPQKSLKAEFLTECAVKAALMEFAEAYHSQDIPALLSFYAPDNDVVVIGSTEEEKCVGIQAIREAYERDFAQSGPVLLEFTWISVFAVGSVSWVAAECLAHATVDEEVNTFPARLTVVLENRDERWLILQQHFSFPAAS